MPTLREGSVLVIGQVIDIENLNNFDTKAYEGKKVLISTGDGFVAVKLNAEQVDAVRPEHFKHYAWNVRFGAWSRDGGSANVTGRYSAPVTEDQIDRIVSAFGSTVPATAAA